LSFLKTLTKIFVPMPVISLHDSIAVKLRPLVGIGSTCIPEIMATILITHHRTCEKWTNRNSGFVCLLLIGSPWSHLSRLELLELPSTTVHPLSGARRIRLHRVPNPEATFRILLVVCRIGTVGSPRSELDLPKRSDLSNSAIFRITCIKRSSGHTIEERNESMCQSVPNVELLCSSKHFLRVEPVGEPVHNGI